MEKNKAFRYIVIKDGKADLRYTDDFSKLLKEEFQSGYESDDFLFYPYKGIRVFVGLLSQFEEEKSLIVYTKGDRSEGYTLNGTILFGKLSESSGFRSLSKKETIFLMKNIRLETEGLSIVNEWPKHYWPDGKNYDLSSYI